jgi:hypothetical protein
MVTLRAGSGFRYRLPISLECLESRVLLSGVTVLTAFDAYRTGTPTSAPDTDGAVGPNQVVTFINFSYSVQDKNTGQQLANSSTDAFWQSLGLSPSTAFDPRVVYDPISQRFFASASGALTGANTPIFIAVSKDSNPLDGWAGCSLSSQYSSTRADYPMLGVDKNGVYISVNEMHLNDNGLTGNSELFAIPKADLLWGGAGQPASPTAANATRIVRTNNLSIMPSDDFNSSKAAGDPEILTLAFPSQTEWEDLYSLTWSGGTATLSGPTAVSSGVQVTSGPANPAEPQSWALEDQGQQKNANRVVNGSLYTVADAYVNNRFGLVWSKIRLSDHSVLASGSIADPSADLFMGSLAVNDSGDMAIGFTKTSATQDPSAYVWERLADGTTSDQTETGVGTAVYSDGGNPSRWGDYSATWVDPSDSSMFWSIQEYATVPNNSNGYQLRWAKFSMATPAIPAAPSGLAASPVSSTQINLSWTDNSNNESGFKVYLSTDGTNFSLYQTIDTPNTTSSSVTGLSPGTEYWFKVTAFNGSGESGASSTNAETFHVIKFQGVDDIPPGGDQMALIDRVKIAPTGFKFGNLSFDATTLGSPYWEYINGTNSADGAPWTFSGLTGLSSYNGAFHGSQAAIEGTQYAFIQGGSASTIAQTLTFPVGGNYTIDLLAAQRTGFAQLPEDFEVYVDDVPKMLITPTNGNWQSFYTPSFTVTAGAHTIKFQGVDSKGGDNSVLIDSVFIGLALSNASFEAPAVADYQPDPAYVDPTQKWNFSGLTGVAANGGTIAAQSTFSGKQYAFVQGGPTAIFTQDIPLVDGVSYQISFNMEQRVSTGPTRVNNEDFNVYVDAKQVAHADPTNGNWQGLLTDSFTPQAGGGVMAPTGGQMASIGIQLDGLAQQQVIDLNAGKTSSTASGPSTTVDRAPPAAIWVSSTATDGVHSVGAVLPITIDFSDTVFVSGTPTLSLNNGATAVYSGGSGTNTLTFNYMVGPGQAISDLDYSGTAALLLNTGTIRDALGHNATLTLFVPGDPGSLGFNKDLIVVDTPGD